MKSVDDVLDDLFMKRPIYICEKERQKQRPLTDIQDKFGPSFRRAYVTRLEYRDLVGATPTCALYRSSQILGRRETSLFSRLGHRGKLVGQIQSF